MSRSSYNFMIKEHDLLSKKLIVRVGEDSAKNDKTV
jgi:hypothetical protein